MDSYLLERILSKLSERDLLNLAYEKWAYPAIQRIFDKVQIIRTNLEFLDACCDDHIIAIKKTMKKPFYKINYNWGLYGACKGDHRNLVNLMIEKGANNWNLGLKGACYGGHSDLVNLMIEKGADNCYSCGPSINEHMQ